MYLIQGQVFYILKVFALTVKAYWQITNALTQKRRLITTQVEELDLAVCVKKKKKKEYKDNENGRKTYN